jgi:hypothetical protein
MSVWVRVNGFRGSGLMFVRLGAILDEVGIGWQVSARDDRPLLRLWGVMQDLQFGFGALAGGATPKAEEFLAIIRSRPPG